MPVSLAEAYRLFVELSGPEPESREELKARAKEIDNRAGFNSEDLATFIAAEDEEGNPAEGAVQEAIFIGAQHCYEGMQASRHLNGYPMDEEVWQELWETVPWLCAFTQDVLVVALKYGMFIGAIHARENAAELRDSIHGDPDAPSS